LEHAVEQTNIIAQVFFTSLFLLYLAKSTYLLQKKKHEYRAWQLNLHRKPASFHFTHHRANKMTQTPAKPTSGAKKN
jgi:hypothetical protein